MKATISPFSVLPLDNPIWNALSTEQAYLAQGTPMAMRFPKDLAPFAAMPNQSAAAYRALEQTLAGEVAALFLDTPPILPPDWSMVHSGEMYQMLFDAPLLPEPDHPVRKLSQPDIPEILALTKLTEPGPFLSRTIELGDYYGIFESGSLAAMAGERLHLTGYTEVSAVCTHPDFRGRGYSHALMATVMRGILNRGETPFLHVRKENPAVHLYRKLGFQVRAELHLAVVQYVSSPPSYNQQ
jgi:GNAT superfamily N-acetyltransferase